MGFFSRYSLSPALRKLKDNVDKLKRVKAVEKGNQDPFFTELMHFVHSVLTTRNVEFKMYEDFYAGGEAQKNYFTKFRDEPDEEYFRRLDESVVINKCRRVVLKDVSSLYGFNVARRMEDEAAHGRMMKTWRFNDVEVGYFHLNLALETGRFGFCVVQNRYVRTDNRMPVFARVGPDSGCDVEYIIQRPHLIIPMPDAANPTKMGALIRLTLEDRENVLFSDTMPEVAFVEYVDHEIWKKWAIDVKDLQNFKEVVTAQPIPVEFGPRYTDVNPYGDVNIPFSLYRNIGESAFTLDGASDLVDITEPQRRYNQTLSDDGHVISHHAFPLLFAKGARIPDDWVRGVNDTVSTHNTDADMKYITWESNLEASATYEDRLERMIRELSGHSPISDGDLRLIGQLRNLRGAMMPDLLTIMHKRRFYAYAERQHARATLAMIEWHEGTEYPNKHLDIKFSDEFIPTDMLTVAETKAVEIGAGIENIRDEIKRRHPELETDAEIDDKVEETIELLRLFGKMPTPAVQSQADREKAQNRQALQQ